MKFEKFIARAKKFVQKAKRSKNTRKSRRHPARAALSAGAQENRRFPVTVRRRGKRHLVLKICKFVSTCGII